MTGNRNPKRARNKIPDDAPIAPVRVDDELQFGLRLAAKKCQVGATRMVNIAIREMLERGGFPTNGPAQEQTG